MNAIWISLKENIKCSSKIKDVAHKATVPKRSSSFDEDNDTTTNRFHELGKGEASRNVIEMIFRSSSSAKAKPRKIKRVLKVNNPADVVANFENYRRQVMMSSKQQHPRTVVDGNEVLQFYGTTMSCCCSRLRVSRLCSLAGCRVCRLIASGFDTYYNKIHGIRLSTKSNAMTEEVGAAAAHKAVIICRTIAAGVEYSVGDTILVPNPTALLPCFVILFH
ncbi:uncharacterized protein LOC130986209 [Salvia miltiorrhiza]|uniref:uncharacterized protein LOC130986209 n=1 Tax=Salvia miltiorrhiza TaxID=226208 RepID=UPI0025AC79D7|nr:uncharacterized protein LOC130986209 [Salvia miltiorrhiza]